MRISYGDLKKIINEVAVSPSLFRNGHEPTDSPFEHDNVEQAIDGLARSFRMAVGKNLFLDNEDSYDPETREFDDAVYERIMSTVDTSEKSMKAAVHKALEASWRTAMQGVGTGTRKVAA